MRRAAGQAALRVWITMHRLLTLVFAIAVLGSVALGLFAWRLSQGPLELAWLAQRVEAAVNTEGGPRLSIGSAALAWEGFRAGVDRPLDIRLRDIAATTATGEPIFTLPAAEISLSLRALLIGRFEPRAIALHGAELTAEREADGTLSLDLGQGLPADPAAAADMPGILDALLTELARPAATDRGEFREARLSQLRRVHISDASLTVVDKQLGTSWGASNVDLDLRRRASGGIDGTADITLAIGPEQAQLRLDLALAEGIQSGQAAASLSPVSPAALSRLSRALEPLAVLDAKLALEGRISLGPALSLREGELRAHVGAGMLNLGGAPVVLHQADATIAVNAGSGSLRTLRLEIAPDADGPRTVLTATGELAQRNGEWQGKGRVSFDRVGFADLPILWPPALSRNARTWITRNMTTGIAHDAALDIALTANADFTDIKVTEVKGGLQAEDITVHWLRPAPPGERLDARLVITEPDSLDLYTTTGHQRLENARGESVGSLSAQAGHLHFSGLTQVDQYLQIELDVSGPVADFIALLRHPRLGILDRSPFELRDPAGNMNGHLSIGLLLEHETTLDDVNIHATARMEGVRLAGVAAGHDLEQGELELDATKEGLRIKGQASIAKLPGQLDVALDFRDGGSAQVLQRITASTRADIRALTALADLNLGKLANGPAAAQIVYTKRRDGAAEMRVTGDLKETDLGFSPLAWSKPPGQPASLQTRLVIQRNRIASIEDLALTGEALELRGRLERQNGHLGLLHLTRARFGRTDGAGRISFQPNGTITARLEGPSLDLAPRLTVTPTPPPREEAKDDPWTLDARFATAFLANDVRADNFTFHADSDGAAIQTLRLDAIAGAEPFQLRIMRERGVRQLFATSNDAGTLLRGLDVAKTLAGGRLNVEARYDDTRPDRPLIGAARIEDFRILNAPAVTRVLQAMTLYGLVQLSQGPGLGISKLVAPFRLTDTMLQFDDARAFNPSLGVTLKGSIDRVRQTCDLDGTIVPAYFFNSLLGDIPLIGKLFAPEAGGGLFAASYSVTGPLDNPKVAVNPLSALTPGFLRGLLGNP